MVALAHIQDPPELLFSALTFQQLDLFPPCLIALFFMYSLAYKIKHERLL